MTPRDWTYTPCVACMLFHPCSKSIHVVSAGTFVSLGSETDDANNSYNDSNINMIITNGLSTLFMQLLRLLHKSEVTGVKKQMERKNMYLQ